jgi:hypothetical protein
MSSILAMTFVSALLWLSAPLASLMTREPG